jgi:hypothetical protein
MYAFALDVQQNFIVTTWILYVIFVHQNLSCAAACTHDGGARDVRRAAERAERMHLEGAGDRG